MDEAGDGGVVVLAERIGVLAGIVVIRTFLSFSLELEITGSWPWRKRANAQVADDVVNS